MKKTLFALFNFPLLWRGLGGGLLLLSGFGTVAVAQHAEINAGATYTIASTVAAASAATYRWLENGQVVSGATAANYTVPSTKVAGIYRYIRQAKSADCTEWQSSNEFVVSVVGPAATATLAPYMDPRDGKVYQTVKMPDGKVWFAENLNYTKDLYYNAASNVANGSAFTAIANGVPAIGSYWCPPVYWNSGAALPAAQLVPGSQGACEVYGALYTWETAMMVDGKYTDEAKTSSAWSETWVSSNTFTSGAPGSTANADKNNARGATNVKGGGRGICPPGWHIPTDREWATMLDKVEGGSTYSTSQTGTGFWGSTVTTVAAGVKLKSQAIFSGTDPGTGSWLDHDNRGSNVSGFGAVPAGGRDLNGSQLNYRGLRSPIWSSSVGSSGYAWYREFRYGDAQVRRFFSDRSYGFSVRCVRD
jgi:uncharacterized protein (TIGR02145 family)